MTLPLRELGVHSIVELLSLSFIVKFQTHHEFLQEHRQNKTDY